MKLTELAENTVWNFSLAWHTPEDALPIPPKLPPMLKIDMHTHLLPRKIPRFAERFGYGDFISLSPNGPGKADMMKGNTFFRTILANCWDPAIRIAEYQGWKVDMQVVSTVPVMFSYWAKPTDGWEVARFLNDDFAETVAQYPRHYLALGTLPMQDINLSIKELQRCKEGLRFPGIQIGSNINGKNLDDPAFHPLWKAFEDLDMALLIHPWEMMGEADMRKYWLPWLVGMPAETTRAICSLIFGGVLEKFPRLRVAFAHAGGSFFSTLGRIEHGFNCRPDLVAVDNPLPPSHYLGKFWVDNVTHDPELFMKVKSMIGAEKICLGSDYPFPLGDLTGGQWLNDLPLTPEEREAVFFRSTLDWLRLPVPEFTGGESLTPEKGT